MKIGEFETGARVIKTNAAPVDAAYACIGTVHRKDDLIGVEWDSWQDHVVVYGSKDEGFEHAPAGVEK